MTVYSDTFKETMVRKMTGPDGRSATSLAAEVGIPQSTLSRWLLRYGSVDTGSKTISAKKRPNNWPAEKQLEALREYDGMTDEEARGGFLRENGLHSADLDRWRQEIVEALKHKPNRSDPRDRRIKELEKELSLLKWLVTSTQVSVSELSRVIPSGRSRLHQDRNEA